MSHDLGAQAEIERFETVAHANGAVFREIALVDTRDNSMSRFGVLVVLAYPIWMPGMAEAEPIGYYEDLADAFGPTIDPIGPSFGVEMLLAELSGSTRLATFVGEGSRYLWPESYDLRSIPVMDPTPVYPLPVIWRAATRTPSSRTSSSTSKPATAPPPTTPCGSRTGPAEPSVADDDFADACALPVHAFAGGEVADRHERDRGLVSDQAADHRCGDSTAPERGRDIGIKDDDAHD
ncbi:MAG: hypothetical protein QOF99_2751 [Pseudonocardiales bacterium]|jgi:hypothetical protein|nr:hypothetical protein [Pseudonocardiales bacterium]